MLKVETRYNMLTAQEINERGCPVEVFPPRIANFIRGFAKGAGTQESYVASGVLACLAGICDESTIKIKAGYIDHPNLYLAIVGHPGVSKTAAVSAALKPLMKLEAIKNADYKKKKDRFEEELKSASSKERKELEKRRPTREPSKLVSDGSLEGMFTHMETQYDAGRQPHCVYVRDELNGFFGGMNKYKKSGGDDNEMWLQLFTGQNISKTLVLKTIFVENARATVIGGIQPEVYRKAMQDKGDGMIDRFMIAFYDGKAPATDIRSRCPENVIEAYYACMDEIIDAERKAYSFWACNGKDMVDAMLDSVQEFHDWCHATGETYNSGAFKKWEQCFYRVCILLGEAWDKRVMDMETIARAKDLSAYFAVNWIKTRDMAQETDEQRLATKVLEALEKKGTMGSRELAQLLHVKSGQILEVINILKENSKVIESKQGRRLVYDYAAY
jgi:hypothetical protein